MKKMLLGLALVGSLVFGARAAERVRWPVWFAFNSTEDTDVIGWRVNWFYGQCDQMTGIDLLGFIGRSASFHGIEANLLRNDVTDTMAGWQIGLYNTAGRCDAFGIQCGLWNECGEIVGFQAGLVNMCDNVTGFQVGLLNVAESAHGFQLGAINLIKSGTEVPFFPVLNVNF